MAVFNSRDQFMSEGGLRAAAGLDLGQHECSICLDAGSAETWDQLEGDLKGSCATSMYAYIL
jgi:hypothetical protein